MPSDDSGIALWREASKQLIRTLRGKRSQLALSRRLKYKANPIRSWEAGRRYPTAVETFRLAQKVGVDIEAAIQRFHPACGGIFLCDPERSDETLSAWLTELKGSLTVAELARRSGRSRYAISRCLTGESRPRLPEFLELVEAITGRTNDLLSEIVGPDALPALASMQSQQRAARDLAFEEPWTEAIMRMLETEEYRALEAHRTGWLTRKLQLPADAEERCIGRMMDAGIIEMKDNRLVAGATLTIDTGANPDKVLSLKTHWAKVGVERLQDTPHDNDLFAYNAISLSKQDLERVRTLLQHTYREIRSIVAATKSEEVAALVQIQLINWEE
ncbi:MAG: DUF4423 domain-containing protein [Kofleriaceae bacterium]|nr:DUF4423 domain-containing protein [Kofleriaceae bacterium]